MPEVPSSPSGRRDNLSPPLAGWRQGPAEGAAVLDISSSTVETAHGTVRGTVDGGVRVFRGIRYGATTAPSCPAWWA